MLWKYIKLHSEHRFRISTELLMEDLIEMNTDALRDLRNNVIARGFVSKEPCYISHAKGATIYDIEGKEYIDFTGGIAVMNVGHSHPKIVGAIKDQAERFTHTCFMVVPYAGAVLLAEKLCAIAPGNSPKKAFFTNSGAEAIENAVKIARYYTKKTGIVVFDNAFHGRTLLTMTMTSKAKPYKYGFGPFAPEIYRMPFAYCYRCTYGMQYPQCNVICADYINELFISCPPESIAAVVVEPVQGEGGFITPPPEYFHKLASICRSNGILLICDEIQSGMGRTGSKMCAIEHWGVEPDVVVMAKSLAAGMPLSAVIGKQDIMDSVHPSGIGGTYGGNPVSCAAALAVLKVYEEENILEKSEKLGKKVKAAFDSMYKKYEMIGEVRGLGPMLALELVKDRGSKEADAKTASLVTARAYEKGLFVLSCGQYGNVIRTMMPLTITDKELDRGLSILDDVFASI